LRTLPVLLVLVVWPFGPFSGHGLPDLLLPTFSIPCYRLPGSISQAFLQTASTNLSLSFPTALLPQRYPPITSFWRGGYENHPSLLCGQPTNLQSFSRLITPHLLYNCFHHLCTGPYHQ